MLASVNLFSTKENEINKFLDSFYQKKVDTNDLLSWSKEYNNPILSRMQGEFRFFYWKVGLFPDI